MIKLKRQHQRYKTYKDSKVNWGISVPENWKQERLRFSVRLNPSKTAVEKLSDDTEVSFLPMEAVSVEGNVDLSNTKKLEDVKNGYTYFKNKDVLIAKITPCFENGKGALVDNLTNNIGFGSTEFIVLRVQKDSAPKFIYYLTHSHIFSSLGEAGMKGSAGQKRVPELFVKDFMFSKPLLNDQTTIANYLDQKTTLIDQIIEKKKRQIELLKEKRSVVINKAVTRGMDDGEEMKDSGVEWIGEVPKGWKIQGLKQILRIFGRIGFRGYTTEDIVSEGEGAISLSPSNIVENKILLNDKTYISWGKYEESPEIKVYEGDLLFVKTGSTIGKVAIATESEEKKTINPQLVVFKKVRINRLFLYYYMISNAFLFQVKSSVVGGSTPALNQNKLGSFKVFIPQSKEQDQIVEFLKQETQKIDSTIQKIEQSIALMQEYKTALISNVVTGKVKVI